jgi:hypothetical protein
VDAESGVIAQIRDCVLNCRKLRISGSRLSLRSKRRWSYEFPHLMVCTSSKYNFHQVTAFSFNCLTVFRAFRLIHSKKFPKFSLPREPRQRVLALSNFPSFPHSSQPRLGLSNLSPAFLFLSPYSNYVRMTNMTRLGQPQVKQNQALEV